MEARNAGLAGSFTVRLMRKDPMAIHDHNDDSELEGLNAELTRSLSRCRRLLFDYRSQLAANTNQPELLDKEDDRLIG